MSTTIILERGVDRARAYEKIRSDLVRCKARAYAMGLPEVAKQVNLAIEELDAIEMGAEPLPSPTPLASSKNVARSKK